MSSNKVNIVCLLWKGNFRGRDYTEKDVVRLKSMIDAYIDRDYTFYCLTNDMGIDVPAEKIELVKNWPGWWGKVELFRPDMPCGRTLYLDLDTHIVSNLKPILDFKGDLVMFPTPYMRKKRVNTEGKIVIPRYQAGTMLFTSGTLTSIFRDFHKVAEFYMQTYRSEQDIYGEWLPNQPTFPARWLMKASEYIKNGYNLKKDTIIVSGQPKSVSFRNLMKMKVKMEV